MASLLLNRTSGFLATACSSSMRFGNAARSGLVLPTSISSNMTALLCSVDGTSNATGAGIKSSSSGSLGTSPLFDGHLSPFCRQQVRFGNTRMCTKTQLQQVYCSLPLRRRWRKALQKGTMKWDEKVGQLLMPTLVIEGHEKGKKPYKGRLENCRSQRIMFQY
ncbi:unnamed protein product [Amoebophrya sp. A25]|nr:unnamed protein product [Amoebophrya sp. A25]|eukprot:GSA25T00019344001.1